jgi:peptide/nickel transport system ATP-binding protein
MNHTGPNRVPLLSVHGLSTDFLTPDGKSAHAVEDVSFDVYPGQTLGLVGESGCGKTTTLMSILRLLPASGRITAGEVFLQDYRGQRIDLLSLSEAEMRRYRWREISMVFQGAMNALNPVVRVGDQIREAILHHQLMSSENAEKRVDDLLDLVGIARSRRDQYPHQYSGGMRQRAMIAMALACDPRLLFADEPTTALDVMIQAQVLELLKRIQQELELAIVLVTHDLGVVAEICDSLVVMYGGKVAEYGPIDAIYNAPQHPYTKLLLQAFPDLSRPVETLISIPGAPPILSELPPGCRFEPRCPVRLERCAVVDPVLKEISQFSSEELHRATSPSGPNAIKTAVHLKRHLAACHLLESKI